MAIRKASRNEEIYKRRMQGIRATVLAQEFNLSVSRIGAIVHQEDKRENRKKDGVDKKLAEIRHLIVGVEHKRQKLLEQAKVYAIQIGSLQEEWRQVRWGGRK
jgi:hypothetical protein